MRHVKRNHQLAGLVKLFEQESGLSLRSAQRHAHNESPEWRQFMSRHAQQSPAVTGKAAGRPEDVTAHMTLLDPDAPPPPPPENKKPGSQDDDDFDETGMIAEEVAMRTQWRLYKQNRTQAIEWAKKGDANMAGGFARNATEILKSYWSARREWLRAQQEARALVPAGEFDDFKGTVRAIAMLVRNGGKEIAQEANPQNPDVALRAWERWLAGRLNPQLQALLGSMMSGPVLPAAA